MMPPNAPNPNRTRLYVGDGIQRHAHDVHSGYGPAFHQQRCDWGQWPFDCYDPPPSEPGLMTIQDPQTVRKFKPRLPDGSIAQPFPRDPMSYTQDTTPPNA